MFSKLITKAEASYVLSLLSTVSSFGPVGSWIRDSLSRGLLNAGLNWASYIISGGTSDESQISGPNDFAVGGSAYSMTWVQSKYYVIGILWTGAIVWVTFHLTRRLSNTVGCHIEMPRKRRETAKIKVPHGTKM